MSRSLRTTTRLHRVHNYRRLSSGKYAAPPKHDRKLFHRRHWVELTRSQLATEAVAPGATRRAFSRSPLPRPFRPFIGPTLKAGSGSIPARLDCLSKPREFWPGWLPFSGSRDRSKHGPPCTMRAWRRLLDLGRAVAIHESAPHLHAHKFNCSQSHNFTIGQGQ